MILKKAGLWYLYFIFFLSSTAVYSRENIALEPTQSTQSTLEKVEQDLVKAIATEDAFLSLLDQDSPTVVMCWMDNCPHCNTIKPAFNKLAQEPKYKKISFAQANGPALKIHKHVARETEHSDKPLKIPGFPSFVFIKGKRIVDVLIGGNEDKLKQKLKSLI